MSASEYLGHGAGTGGLQRHSIGDAYPYTVIARQNGPYGALRWRVLDCRNGQESDDLPTHRAAEIEISRLKIRNMMHS